MDRRFSGLFPKPPIVPILSRVVAVEPLMFHVTRLRVVPLAARRALAPLDGVRAPERAQTPQTDGRRPLVAHHARFLSRGAPTIAS